MQFKLQHTSLAVLLAYSLAGSINVYAATPIEFFNTAQAKAGISITTITRIVQRNFAVDQYRVVKVQVINNRKQQPHHCDSTIYYYG